MKTVEICLSAIQVQRMGCLFYNITLNSYFLIRSKLSQTEVEGRCFTSALSDGVNTRSVQGYPLVNQ